jgi:hydroxymethylbilane synthase
MTDRPRLRIGTRGSPLARWQAEHVAALLAASGIEVELIHITTQGDVTTGPLGAIGGQGLFTKEIQRALLDDRIDLAVHSLKDLPTEHVPGLALAAVPERESPGDVLVCSQAKSLDELPRQSRIGTGSTRRKAQLLFARPDLQVLDIRGNVETRLRKLDEGDYDAIVDHARVRQIAHASRRGARSARFGNASR